LHEHLFERRHAKVIEVIDINQTSVSRSDSVRDCGLARTRRTREDDQSHNHIIRHQLDVQTRHTSCGDDAVCYGRTEGRFPIKTLTLNVGEKRPLGVNTGTLAIMAFLDDEEVDRLIRTRAGARSNYPIKDVALRKMIIRARARGHSRIDGEIMPGMSGVGVPVRNSRGFPVAALSVAAISARLEEPRRGQIALRLKQEAKRMQEELAGLL